MIPVSEPLLDDEDLENVKECVESGWISSAGEYIERFEEAWARRCDRRFGVAVSNGTVALQLAVAALEPEPGDEIIMPTFTIISCALAAIYNGCTPVLVDADPDTWCMDVEQIEHRITSRTLAIMVVHIYGHPVDMNPVIELAERHGLAIIEDAAEAHGAEYFSEGSGVWKQCGSFGDVSTFSFYANKLITTGEGGMVLTDDPELAERARLLRNLGFHGDRRFSHDVLGFNFRMTNVQAALGVGQVGRLASIVQMKRTIAEKYRARLSEVDSLTLPIERPWALNVYWVFGVLVREDAGDSLTLARALSETGVQTRPFFVGMHEQPALLERGLFGGERYQVSEDLARRGLYLPSGLTITDEQIDEVSKKLIGALA